MTGEWRQARFGEIAEVLPGKYIPASDYDPAGTYLIYGSNSVMGRSRLPLYEGPIVAFARIGSNCGATMYSAGPCWINNNAAGIRAKTGCDTRFLYYWMQSFDFAQIREGSGQPYISDRTLKEQVLLIPPLPEQRAIAHILGTLDDKIELNRRMSQTLEAMARALFKSWFVDFDPVRWKMERKGAKAPSRTETKTSLASSRPGGFALPPALAALFPDRLVDSELGPIPEGWKVKPIGDLAEVVGSSTPRTDRAEYWEGGTHHWVTPKDLSALSFPVLLDTERKITDAGLAQISSGLLPKGTVLLSSRAPIGYLAIAEVPVAVNQGFIAMKPRPGISNLFLLRWTSAAHEEILSHANGSTFLEISKSSFRPILLVAPSAPSWTPLTVFRVRCIERSSRTSANLARWPPCGMRCCPS